MISGGGGGGMVAVFPFYRGRKWNFRQAKLAVPVYKVNTSGSLDSHPSMSTPQAHLFMEDEQSGVS